MGVIPSLCRRHLTHFFHKTCRTTDPGVKARFGHREMCRQRCARAGGMNEALTEPGEFAPKRRAFTVSDVIMQRERRSGRLQLQGHRIQRRNANPRRQQQNPLCLLQRKQVARSRYHQLLPGTQRLVNVARPAARGGFTPHANKIALVPTCSGQGIRAHHAAGQVDINVRPGLPRRQRVAVISHQPDGEAFVALAPQPVNNHAQHIGLRHTRKNSPKPIFFSPRR